MMHTTTTTLERAWWAAAGLVGALTVAMILACAGPQESTFVRGEEAPGIDNPAMSTGLDKVDLEKLFQQNMTEFYRSGFFRDTRSQSHTIAIFPVKNDTSEHIGGQLQALLSKMETRLVNERDYKVVSNENQQAMLQEMKLQQSALYDKSKAVQVGKRLGADYFLTGKVYDSAERTTDVRRVQYFL
ncbi:MAG: CsgG/HfaB family protein, partial [Myxococcota bacterium]